MLNLFQVLLFYYYLFFFDIPFIQPLFTIILLTTRVAAYCFISVQKYTIVLTCIENNIIFFFNSLFFSAGLNILSEKGTMDEKLEFSFMIYDFDGDGAISRDELAQMLIASFEESGLSLTEAQAKACCDYTIKNIIKPANPSFISKAEYVKMVKEQKEKGHDMMKALSVDVTSRIKVIAKESKRSK